MKKYYAGIGARKSPKRILNYIQDIAEILAEKDYVLRSCVAYGADSAFEIGCDRKQGKKEIYLPWDNFGKSNSKLIVCNKLNSTHLYAYITFFLVHLYV
jgi:hypothetical protein